MINRIKCNVCVLLTTAVCFALGACSGEVGDSMPEVPANPDALCVITPHAVEISPVDASKTPITRSATGKPEQKATYTENLGVNYSAEATLEAEPQDAQTRAGASLAAGAQYRIVVYDGSGAIVGNVVYKQGSTDIASGDAIKLKAGTYRLFAYTFNSASAIRELDADNRNVTVNSGEDFMTYTNTAFTISSTDYDSGKALNISFIRQFVRLTVTIMTNGYAGGKVYEASLTMGNVFGSGSKWDGMTHTDASTLPSTNGTVFLTKASGNAISVDCGPSADNPYLITSPCTHQYISVMGLNVTIQGAGIKTIPDFVFQNPVTLVKGGSYRLTITVGNYYLLTRTSPVTIGGVKWARTNLEQTESGNSASVSFATNPWDYGNLWSWGIRDATRYGATIYQSGYVNWDKSADGDPNQDPCQSSSLGSGWRLPTQGDLSSLSNTPASNGTKVKINDRINTIGDYGWAPDAKGGVFMNGNQVIFLPAAGLRSFDGTMGSQNYCSYCWSSTSSGNNNAYLLLVSNAYLEVRLNYRNYGYSLRCVQN